MLCGPGGTGPSRCRCAATLRQAEPETPRREGFSKAGAQRGSRCLQASRGTAFYLLSPLPLSPSPAVPCPLCPSASAEQVAEEVQLHTDRPTITSRDVGECDHHVQLPDPPLQRAHTIRSARSHPVCKPQLPQVVVQCTAIGMVTEASASQPVRTAT